MIYIMEMFTRMILNKAQLPALKSFLYLFFQIWQIMSWYSFVCVKIIFFRFKKSEKKLPQKKRFKKKKKE
jgi:type II secretory pathway component PulF